MIVFKNKVKPKPDGNAFTKMLADNKNRYAFRAQDDNTVEVSILGEIDDFWAYGVRDLAFQLNQKPHKIIDVTIHSEGGDVVTGMGLRNTLIGDPAKVRTRAVGFVASIATVVLLAGDKGNISMPANSYFMVHNVWAFAMGEADELRSMADTMDKMTTDIVNIYVDAIAERGKLIDKSRQKTEEQVRQWMDAETWFTADEALQHGFIDEVTAGVQFVSDDNAAQMSEALGKFKNAPAPLTKIVNQKVKAMRNGPNDDPNFIQKFVTAIQSAFNTEPTTEETETTDEELQAARELLEGAGYNLTEPQEETTATDEELAAAQELLSGAGYSVEAPEEEEEEETETTEADLEAARQLLEGNGFSIEEPEEEAGEGDNVSDDAATAIVETVQNMIQENLNEFRQDLKPNALKKKGLPTTTKTTTGKNGKSTKQTGAGKNRKRTGKFDQFAKDLHKMALKG